MATLTSDMRNTVVLSIDGGMVTYRYLTLAELNAIKSFDSESLSYLESLDAEDALRCIANAIPAKLLEAVYRTCIECVADETS